MSRVLKLTYLSVVALLLVTFVFGRAAPINPPQTEVRTDEPIYVRLHKVIDFNGVDDPRATLAEQLQILGKQHNLVIEINEMAFNFENVRDVAKTPVADATPIPPLKNVRLELVLHKMLNRVPIPSGTTYTIRRDHVEITTNTFQKREFWPKMPDDMEPIFPLLINANYDKTPLDEALKDLADRFDVTIVLDKKAVEKEKPTVTARLINTPLDTAVQLLAEMSDLRSVAIGKTLFVTTTAKAKRLYKEQQPKIVPMPGGFGVIGAIGNIGGPCFIGAFGAIGNPGAGVGNLGVPPAGNFRPRIALGGGQ